MSSEGHSDDGFDGDQVLVAEYVLGLLPAAEHERMGHRLAAEPALAEELRLWQRRLAGLDREFSEAAPPAAVLTRIESRLFDSARASGGFAAFWNNVALWRGLAAAGLAVALLAVGFNLQRPAPLDPQALATQLVAALQAQEGSGVEFVALYDTATGNVRLTALSGAAVPDKDFELWMIEASGTAVSMGVIPTERTEMPVNPSLRRHFTPGTVLAVTLEPKGGSPTGVATGPIVALGKATPI